MNTLLELNILITGTFLGITLGLFLVFVKSAKSRANYFLAIIIFGFAAILLPGYLYYLDLLESFPYLISIYLPFTWGYGAFMYLYVRACTEKDFKMRPILWLHFLPVLLGTLYHADIYLMSGAEKAAYGKTLVEAGETGFPKYIAGIKMLLSLIYYVLSIRLILNYRKHLTNATSAIDYTFHRWLLFFVSLSLFPIVVLSLFGLLGIQFVPTTSTFAMSFLYIAAVYGAILWKPRLFRAFPHQIVVPKTKVEAEKKQRKRYESSNLQEVQKEKFVQRLLDNMETKHLYRAPELTLTELAEQVDIPSHYLSQVINEKLECSFLDFINGYRIKEAKEKLHDEKLEHYTILAIAYEAGFNSKSAFYAAFKKHVGTTPSAFRKQAVTA